MALHAVGMSATDIQAAIDREDDKQRDMVKLGMTTQAGVVLPPKDDTSNPVSYTHLTLPTILLV